MLLLVASNALESLPDRAGIVRKELAFEFGNNANSIESIQSVSCRCNQYSVNTTRIVSLQPLSCQC